MPAQKKNLVHDADTTFRLDLWYEKYDGSKDLTGTTVRLILSEPSNKAPLFTYDYPGTADGHIAIHVAPVESVKWDLGKYAYRLDIVDGPDTDRVLFGALDVKSGVDV